MKKINFFSLSSHERVIFVWCVCKFIMMRHMKCVYVTAPKDSVITINKLRVKNNFVKSNSHKKCSLFIKSTVSQFFCDGGKKETF